ncbi:bifunctional DNA-formamidopyrimidine glycosylase/DNA-(apurinic or apyrimidinic site) lyase [Candidatus Saccharibacteria bacterium]|nr:MAG: bifunctional DNA-formamidopyrimidine glycosylase/DNA-(apurinic or apyrimidinic site) lyase [Candidatus Saccharibacteria bacterium]
MPELPEVETVRRGLSRLIVAKTIVAVEHDHAAPKSFPNTPDDVARFVIGAKISAVRRRAKVLLIELDSGYTLVTHLKMTGQLVFVGAQRFGAGHPNDSLVGDLPDRSTRVTLTLATTTEPKNIPHHKTALAIGSDPEQGRLFFNDQRKFGWMKLYPTVEVPHIDFMRRVGPEPLDDDFTAAVLHERLQRRKNTTIKAALLDQTVLAGIGNIYADESLWAARIHPATLVRDVPQSAIARLVPEMKSILRLALEKGGSTDRNYVNAEGRKGSYIDFARVFRRENQPCSRCGATIEKIRVAGRGTHVCGRCQVQ